MAPTVVYCYDAYCGWCFGFSPVIQRMEARFRGKIAFEVLSGGMILPRKPTHIGVLAKYVLDNCKAVEAHTGVKFGEDYLWHINNPDKSDWFPCSEKPGIALCLFKDLHPQLAVHFASDLQYALCFEGRDLCDDEAYRHLLQKYNIPAGAFYEKLHSAEYKQKTYDEFALCKQLKITGFPAVYLQITERKLYTLADGYTDDATLDARLENVLKESGIANNVQRKRM